LIHFFKRLYEFIIIILPAEEDGLCYSKEVS